MPETKIPPSKSAVFNHIQFADKEQVELDNKYLQAKYMCLVNVFLNREISQISSVMLSSESFISNYLLIKININIDQNKNSKQNKMK